MSKYKVAWSKTYHVSGEVEIEAVSEAHAVQRVKDEMGGYEGSMQYDPKYDYIEVVEGEIPSLVKYEEMEQITREMAEEILMYLTIACNRASARKSAKGRIIEIAPEVLKEAYLMI